MGNKEIKQLIIAMQKLFDEEKRDYFLHLGNNGHYTHRQKKYAFELITEYGIRATSKILKIPRRTLQRWCRGNNIYVRRCPSWVYGWVERRRRKREFWERRGYIY